jgi:hypothetical protein
MMPGPAAPQRPALPTVAQLPTLHLPTPELVAAAIQAAEQERQRFQGGGGGDFWDGPVGPMGQNGPDWSIAPKDFSSFAHIYLCPAIAPGRQPFTQDSSHFWKSQRSPKGDTCGCPDEACPIDEARNSLFRSGNPLDVERAKNGKSRQAALWNILVLDDPYLHLDQQTGKMAPLIWRMPGIVHSTLVKDIFGARDNNQRSVYPMSECLDPNNCRPFRVVKEKTGPLDMNIKWSIHPLDRQPLPQHFWPALYNLHDTGARTRTLIKETARLVITELGFPWTPKAIELWHALPDSVAPAVPPPGAPPAPQAPPMPPAPPYPHPGAFSGSPPVPGYPTAPPAPPAPPYPPQGYPQTPAPPPPPPPTSHHPAPPVPPGWTQEQWAQYLAQQSQAPRG